MPSVSEGYSLMDNPEIKPTERKTGRFETILFYLNILLLILTIISVFYVVFLYQNTGSSNLSWIPNAYPLMIFSVVTTVMLFILFLLNSLFLNKYEWSFYISLLIFILLLISLAINLYVIIYYYLYNPDK